MVAPQLHFVGLYPIDITQETSQKVDVPKTASVADYTQDLINTLLKDETNRLFKFGTSGGMREAVSALASGDYLESPQIIANNLLKIEKDTQEQYKKITTLLKGSLLQACFTTNKQKYVLITKVDHHAFLDEADLTKRVGMPYQEDVLRVLKGCLVAIARDGKFDRATVYDTNLRIAEYWWKDFLQLEEERSNEHNTSRSFAALDQLLATRVKPKSPGDYTFLRNDVISYYRTHKSIRHKRLVNNVLGNYTPSVPEIDADDLKARAGKLPEQKNFDQHFQVQETVNEAKYKNVIELTPNLQLIMKGGIPNLDTVVEPFDEGGVKGIKIITQQGWEHFNRTVATSSK